MIQPFPGIWLRLSPQKWVVQSYNICIYIYRERERKRRSLIRQLSEFSPHLPWWKPPFIGIFRWFSHEFPKFSPPKQWIFGPPRHFVPWPHWGESRAVDQNHEQRRRYQAATKLTFPSTVACNGKIARVLKRTTVLRHLYAIYAKKICIIQYVSLDKIYWRESSIHTGYVWYPGDPHGGFRLGPWFKGSLWRNPEKGSFRLSKLGWCLSNQETSKPRHWDTSNSFHRAVNNEFQQPNIIQFACARIKIEMLRKVDGKRRIESIEKIGCD